MDEKGLAAIFVFGLPGFLHTNHSLPCLSAATKASAVMKGGGIPCNVGIALGLCFCGLVGIAELRCEYAVIGGEPRVLEPAERAACCLLPSITNTSRTEVVRAAKP